MKIKKLLSSAIMLVLLCVFSQSAFAAVVQPDEINRYQEFSHIWASLNQDSGYVYTSGGGATTWDTDLDVHVDVCIQTYVAGTGWVTYGNTLWTDDHVMSASAGGQRYLYTNGTYRTHVVAKAYRNGVLLETISLNSSNVVIART